MINDETNTLTNKSEMFAYISEKQKIHVYEMIKVLYSMIPNNNIKSHDPN